MKVKSHIISSLGFCCLSGLMTLFAFSDVSYAGQWIEKSPNEWYYIKDDGQYACNEMLFDDKGNLYSFDETTKMRSNTESGGLYWGDSGAYLNRMAPESYRGDILKSKFEEFRKNGTVKFKNRDEYVDYLNYSASNYSLQDSNVGHLVYSDGTLELRASEVPNYLVGFDLYDSYYEQMVNTVNSCRGATDAETVRNLANHVINSATYDIEKPAAVTILTEGRGRCSSYSRYFKILCNIANIKCEEIFCKMTYNGSAHAVDRVWFDNKWHYIDLTSYDACGEFYYDIPYTEFFKHYALFDNCGLFRY